MIDIVKIGPL